MRYQRICTFFHSFTVEQLLFWAIFFKCLFQSVLPTEFKNKKYERKKFDILDLYQIKKLHVENAIYVLRTRTRLLEKHVKSTIWENTT